MYTEGFEQWFKVNKNLTTPLNEWNKACTEMCRRMTQQNLELIGENVSRLSERLKRISSVRKPEDFFNLQKECLNEDMAASIEYMQKYIHNSMENFEEFTKLCGSAFGSFQQAAMPAKSSEKSERSEKSGK
ncbi:phasin family protein [Aquicella lusitana]|uniref:Phasin protein n=1 Tax=Aquicella lusitana TaxID=254246 RepID=A0A370G8Y9_9COXI|nr:phasin family protein [Aquicella lusitana]RDI38964.1 phasin protein [Aquicella lusitana]VVC74287.1 hypothetical protein AQULUS_20520 [Aquicella lusitana]